MAVCCALRAVRRAGASPLTALLSRQGTTAQSCGVHTQTYTIKPALESAATDIFGPPGEAASLRDSTRAVAGRLYQQELFCLLDGTPTTYEGALEESNRALIITEAHPPYRITHANAAWEQLCGYKAEEVVNTAGLGFLQGASTDRKTVARINDAVRDGGRIRVTVLNYTKDGEPFFNRLQVSPLRSPLGQVTHMLGILTRTEAV